MHSVSPGPRLGTTLNDGTMGLIALAILLVSVVLWSARGPNVERTDFAMSYVGAHIVQTGMGRHLYDAGLQVALRDSLFQHASPLYFEHPPFEALALSPLGAFSFRTAYTIWGLLNVAVVLGVIIWLRPYLKWPSEDLAYLFLWLIFAPVIVALYQGQSSVLVLAAFATTFVQLKKGSPLVAGVALGLGLLKFQFALPFALVFLFRRQWRFLTGFALSGIVLSLLSLITVGWGGILDYAHFLFRISNNPHSVSYGSAVDMPTLHGLIFALGGHHVGSTELHGIVALFSIALLAWVAWRWKSSTGPVFDVMFASAIGASLLSGSHMFTHDFSPLGLGMFLAGAELTTLRRAPSLALGLAMLIFWAFPLYFLFVKWHCLFLMALVLLVFTWLCSWGADGVAEQNANGALATAG